MSHVDAHVVAHVVQHADAHGLKTRMWHVIDYVRGCYIMRLDARARAETYLSSSDTRDSIYTQSALDKDKREPKLKIVGSSNRRREAYYSKYLRDTSNETLVRNVATSSGTPAGTSSIPIALYASLMPLPCWPKKSL